MRKARCEVIDPAEVSIVHVCSRTVRRCFLFGDDELTGKNFDHRKRWIEKLLKHFAAQFSIYLLTCAVLSNHFYLILRNRSDVVARWDDTEVARRWLMICPHRKDGDGKPMPSSDHTSAKLRIESMRQENSADRLAASSSGEPIEPIRKRPDAMLSPVTIDERNDPIGPCIAAAGDRCSDKGYLPMSVLDYIELLDWTARQSRSAPSGRTPKDMPPLLARLGLSASARCELAGRFGRLFHHVAGCPESIDRLRGHRRGGRFRVNRRVRELMPPRE